MDPNFVSSLSPILYVLLGGGAVKIIDAIVNAFRTRAESKRLDQALDEELEQSEMREGREATKEIIRTLRDEVLRLGKRVAALEKERIEREKEHRAEKAQLEKELSYLREERIMLMSMLRDAGFEV